MVVMVPPRALPITNRMGMLPYVFLIVCFSAHPNRLPSACPLSTRAVSTSTPCLMERRVSPPPLLVCAASDGGSHNVCTYHVSHSSTKSVAQNTARAWEFEPGVGHWIALARNRLGATLTPVFFFFLVLHSLSKSPRYSRLSRRLFTFREPTASNKPARAP